MVVNGHLFVELVKELSLKDTTIWMGWGSIYDQDG